MFSISEIETEKIEAHRQAALAANPPPPSRLAIFFEKFVRHAGAIAVDHTHLLPLDRVSGRTGIFNPPAARTCRCC